MDKCSFCGAKAEFWMDMPEEVFLCAKCNRHFGLDTISIEKAKERKRQKSAEKATEDYLSEFVG